MTHNSIPISYLVCVLVLFPVMGIVSYIRLKWGRPLPAKNRRYRTMIAIQLLLFVYTLAVARQSQVDLFGREWPSFWSWAIAVSYLILMALRLKRAWRRFKPERKQRARLLLPENAAEMLYWVPISLLAGLSEECAFRGMAYVGLRGLAGSAAVAVAACVLAFGIAHMLQGWRGVLGAGVVALLMHAIVYLTQALYLVIAIHGAYDLMVGVIALQNFQREREIQTVQPQPVS